MFAYQPQLLLGDCLERMKDIPSGGVDLVLTDIPYAEVNRASGGLRSLDKRCADVFDNALIPELVGHFHRVTKGAAYVFCGTMQISALCREFTTRGMTVRVAAWNKTNPSPMNGSRLWVSGLEFCVYARKPISIHNERCKKALWDAPSGRSKIHPTQKPTALFETLVLASSNPFDLVLIRSWVPARQVWLAQTQVADSSASSETTLTSSSRRIGSRLHNPPRSFPRQITTTCRGHSSGLSAVY